MRAPSRTVATGSVAGAATIVLLWVFGIIWPAVVVPVEVSAAITLLISSGAAWIVPDPSRSAKH